MKNRSRYFIASSVIALTTVSAAWAGTTPSDNITASPKVRAMLEENNAKYRAAQQTQQGSAQSTITSQAVLAGSPKAQQMRSEKAQVNTVKDSTEVAGYKPTGSDGITASPKVRTMLDEQRQTVEIAPLK
jgi:hypothetical protein